MLRLGRRRRPRRTVDPASKRQCRLRWPAVVCRGGGREPAGGGPFGPSGQRRPAQPAALPLALPDLRARRVQLLPATVWCIDQAYICHCAGASDAAAGRALQPADLDSWPLPESNKATTQVGPMRSAVTLHPCCLPPPSMPWGGSRERVGGSAPISYLPTCQPLNSGNRRSCCGEPGPRSGRPADPSRWRDCDFDDALSQSLLIHLLNVEGGAAE